MVSPPATVRNEQLWRKHCRQVGALARRIVSGEVGVIEGSRRMLKFRQWLHAWEDEDFRIFVGVDSVSHHLPVGEVRVHWLPDALKKKDEEIRALEDYYRKDVVEAAAHVEVKYK
jgi:hypothetical protein